MKLFSSLCWGMVLALLMTSCQELDVNLNGSMIATIDGVAFEANVVAANTLKDTTATSKILTITGTTLGGDIIAIAVTKVGADLDTDCMPLESFASGTTNPAVVTYTKGGSAATSIAANVAISACDLVDKTISGSFSASLEDTSGGTFEITSGTFERVKFL